MDIDLFKKSNANNIKRNKFIVINVYILLSSCYWGLGGCPKAVIVVPLVYYSDGKMYESSFKEWYIRYYAQDVYEILCSTHGVYNQTREKYVYG